MKRHYFKQIQPNQLCQTDQNFQIGHWIKLMGIDFQIGDWEWRSNPQGRSLNFRPKYKWAEHGWSWTQSSTSCWHPYLSQKKCREDQTNQLLMRSSNEISSRPSQCQMHPNRYRYFSRKLSVIITVGFVFPREREILCSQSFHRKLKTSFLRKLSSIFSFSTRKMLCIKRWNSRLHRKTDKYSFLLGNPLVA